MKIKCLIASVVLLAAFLSHAAAATGNCMKMARALSASQSVTLVNEWDPDFADWYNSGVYYYKVTLRKGFVYTIWIEGGNASDMVLSIDTDINNDNAPFATFDLNSRDDGATQYGYMYSDSWFEDDPSSGVYYISIFGEIGAKTTLRYAAGIVPFVKEGEEENPRRIVFSDSSQKDSASLINGDFFYSANLQAGRKYSVRTTGATAAVPLSILVDPSSDAVIEQDPLYAADTNNTSLLIYPQVSQTYTFNVLSAGNGSEAFKLKYHSYPVRSVSEHATIKLVSDGIVFSGEGVPGRREADNTYYDNIIDESLFRVKIPEAGTRWIVDTQGAYSGIGLEVYDNTGALLVSGAQREADDFNRRAAFTSAYAGWHYVGVTDPTMVYEDGAPTGAVITVKATPADSFEPPDAADPADDTYGGAERLVAYPIGVASDVVGAGYRSADHALNGGDWYDWFSFAGYAGVTYSLKAAFSTLQTTKLGLKTKVYKMVDGSLVKVGTSGSLSPAGTSEMNVDPLTFTADANGMYYVRVSVAEGVGMDYPPYCVYAGAFMADKSDLGLVQVKTKGVDTTWYFTDNANALYPNGTQIAIPAGVRKNVRFSVANGYSTPPKTSVTPQLWTGESDSLTVVEGVYNDEYDTADDVESGFVTITPAKSNAKAKRTLWKEDEADWFRFKAVAGYYYNFSLTDTTQEGVGDAVFSIKYYADATNLVEDVTECRKKTFDPREKGKFNLCVHHGTKEKADTAYRLYYQAVNVGTIKFATTTPNVSEGADYVDVVVQRTASEGSVRVNFATEEYTARPGQEYYPTNGVLEWADGDMADKTIRVRLIPDLEEEWDAQLRFRIRLWPMSEDSLADDEYPAMIEADTATIKIKELSSKNPGQIVAFVMYEPVIAGNVLKLGAFRKGGSEGRVAVQVRTQPGTALAGIDYTHISTNVVWKDGEDGLKEVSISTLEAGSLEPRTFNVKLTAQTTGEYGDCETPEISERKVYFTICSEVTSKTYSETVASAKRAGAALSTSGTWYTDSAGNFRCVPPNGMSIKANYTVSSPGFFIVQPSIVDGTGLLRYMTSSAGWVECTSGEKLVIPVADAAGTTISFKLSQTDQSAYVSFARQSNGESFKFIPLSDVWPVPDNLSVVDADMEELRWKVSPEFSGEGLFYRVRMGENAASLSTVCDVTNTTACPLPAGMLTAGKSYFWRVDCAQSELEYPDPGSLEWVSCPATWKFSTAAAAAPATVVKKGYYDAAGNAITGGDTIELAQGVATLFFVGADGDDAVSCSIIGGALPKGLSLYGSGKASKIGRITGTPTEAGEYFALLQTVTASGIAKTLRLDFEVLPIGTAAGTFTASIGEAGSALATGFPRIGRITGVNVTESGGIAATVKVGGQKYAFTAENFDSVGNYGSPVMDYRATLSSIATIDGIPYTNRLELSVASGNPDDDGVLGASAGEVGLVLNIKEEGEVREIAYGGELVRDNSANESWLGAASWFEGYYTVSLVPFGVTPADGVPCGSGYLTLTIDDSGVAKYAGLLADGTALSGSSRIALRGDFSDPLALSALIPIGLYSSPWSFGGVLKLDCAVGVDGYMASAFDSRRVLEWNKDGATSSFDGDGFRIEIRPTGGWYNTLVNLQTYYLNRDFSIEAQGVDGVPEEMLPAGNTYTADTMPHDVNALLGRSSLTPDARVLATKKNSSLYDLAASVNPWKVKTSFVPETGLLSGTFKAWSDGATQVQFATLNHYGVLLMNRDENTPLDKDVWTSGFYLLPVTTDWTFSLPFNIRAVEVDRDWTEAEVPNVE